MNESNYQKKVSVVHDCDCKEGCYGCHLLYKSLDCQCIDESEKDVCTNRNCSIAYERAMAHGVGEDEFYGCSNIY